MSDRDKLAEALREWSAYRTTSNLRADLDAFRAILARHGLAVVPVEPTRARAEIYAAVCGQLASRIASRRYAIEQRDADPVTGPGIGVGYRLLTELEDALSGASALLADLHANIAAAQEPGHGD